VPYSCGFLNMKKRVEVKDLFGIAVAVVVVV